MMNTTCMSSAALLRCRDSRLFNDPTYLLDARFETNPLLIPSSFDCCCCCCCANDYNSTYNRLPRINPSFSCNGLRQSTLIQFSPSKRLIFHGRRRQSCNYTSGVSSLTDSDRNYYYEKLYSFKERRKLGKDRYACWGFDDKRKEQLFSNEIDDDCVDDVEILLDLLSEDVGLENIGVRERKRIQKKDRSYATRKTEIIGSGALKRDLKSNKKVVEVRSREEEDRRVRNSRREEERGRVNSDKRREGSSCSSYYSVSSKDEFESDNNVEIINNDRLVREESSSKYKNDQRRDIYRSYNEEDEEKVSRRQEFDKEKDEIMKKNTAETYYGNQEWRKESEKKLNVESSEHQSQVSVKTERNSQHSENIDRITCQLSTSVQKLTSEHRGETADRVTRQDEYRRQSNVISEASKIHEIDTKVATSSSLEARIKNSEDISTEVSSQVEDRREEHHQKINHLTTLEESRVKLQQISEISDTHITKTKNTSGSHRQSDSRSEKQVNYSPSGVEFAEGTTELMRTGRRTTKASSFHVGMPKETSSTYKALKLNPEPNLQESGAGTSGSSPIVTGSSSERVSGGQFNIELTHHSTERFETATSELQEQRPESSGIQRVEILGGGIGGHAIASADQQEKSSSHFVGEFVKKAKHELSTSAAELVYEDSEQHELKSSDSGNSYKKDGPSDEMWHVTGSSTQQPSEMDVPDNTSTGKGESGKRSSRSLWNVIGDVVRLRWASPRSETNTPKLGGGKALASPNQSTNSEAWFSGHEYEDSNDENVKTGSTKGRSQSQKEASNPYSSNQGSSSMSPSILEESSSPLPAIRMRRSPVVKRTSGTGEIGASGSGIMVKTEQPVPDPLTGISTADASGSGKTVIMDQPVPAHETETHSKDRRKLARMDQVSKDRFDEWEEVYTLEAKQRKNDEFFMREALLEAKKAADFWEVPVGAVLVQDGKVIARGYNLVEELRDSTAHAEMICIREASNNLRSWRLSGTTLYVTLEPCPMCAGAILQARIDTVVWGAPNKLLGADGSWIRLFPDGDGGNGSDKPPAPVHPYHPNMTVRRGVLSSECADVMQQFFQLRRKKKEKKTEAEPPTPPPPSCLPITHHHHSKFFSKMHDAFSIMFCL